MRLRVKGKFISRGAFDRSEAEIELEEIDNQVNGDYVLILARYQEFANDYQVIDTGHFVKNPIVVAIATKVKPIEENKEGLSLCPCQYCYYVNKCGNGWFYNCRNNRFKHWYPQDKKKPTITEKLEGLKKIAPHEKRDILSGGLEHQFTKLIDILIEREKS